MACGELVPRSSSTGSTGREEGIAVHELIGLAGEADAECEAGSWIARYEQGLAMYRARNFDGAIRQFAAVLDQRADDRPAQIMRDRCAQLLRAAPDRSWRPVAALTSK